MESRAERTYQTILQAAHDLFVEQGYHGTSMRQIARRAGVALGGIYNHFAGKEAVFAAVLDVYHPYHQVIPVLEQAPAVTLTDLVHHAARELFRVLQQRPDFLNLALIEMIEFRGRHSEALMSRMMPRLEALIQRFASPDEIRPLPPRALLRLFIGQIIGYFLLNRISLTESTLQPDQIADIFLHGVLKPTE